MRIIVVVWAVVFAFDFFARFTGFSSSAGEGYTAQVASPQKSIPILNEVGLVQYQEKLTAYVNARLANQDRLAEQGQPQAIDSDLSDGDLVEGPGYVKSALSISRLVALAQRLEPIALFDRLDKNSGESRLIELRLGDSIDDYRLSKFLSTGVTLIGPDGESFDLALFERERHSE